MTRDESLTVKSDDADETVEYSIKPNSGVITVTVRNRDTDMSARIGYQDFRQMYEAVMHRLKQWDADMCDVCGAPKNSKEHLGRPCSGGRP